VSPTDLLPTALVALAVGLLIGAVGIGGVLLVPWLTQAAGVPVHAAAAIAMLAFVAPGLAAWVATRGSARGPVDRSAADRRLLWAAVPGTLAGTAALLWLSERAALAVLGVVVIVVGLRLLARPGHRPTDHDQPSQPHAAADAGAAAPPAPPPSPIEADWPSGLVTGFGSGLSATGGPMVLTPLLAWRGVPIRRAIALGQRVQLPVAATASLGHLLGGTAHVGAGLLIGLLLVPGMLAGPRLAHALPQRLLTIAVAAVLLLSGGLFLARSLPP
jgi:uncharacterized membrane protein YfcA